MTRSLRRSRRSTKKGISDYNEGDIVEIDRNGTLARGRLAQLLTEGTSPNPRWLIKFDGQPYKDEEMYERAFGKLLHSAEESEEQTGPELAPAGTPIGVQSAKSSKSTNSTSKGGTSGYSSEGEKSDVVGALATNSSSSSKKGKNGVNDSKKSVQFEGSNNNNVDGSDDSSPVDETSSGTGSQSRRDRKSAREERSRRRQAKIDEEAIPPGTEVLTGKRKLPPPPPGHHSKKLKHDQFAEDGEVVKVKLLTGTLYLYRGVQRRVEFVRRV